MTSRRELEVIKKSISMEENTYEKRYLMAENSAGQNAIYCIPKDGGNHYKEVSVVHDLISPEVFETWEGYGYTGGHTSQSIWNTDQQVDEMFRLICEGFIVLDKTKEGNVSGYYPKVIYWKDPKPYNRFSKDDSRNITLERILSSLKKQ